MNGECLLLPEYPKAMAAATCVAAEGCEETWRVSKEKTDVLFNDCRLAAVEDAQGAAENTESETRKRLHRLVTQVRLRVSMHIQYTESSVTIV